MKKPSKQFVPFAPYIDLPFKLPRYKSVKYFYWRDLPAKLYLLARKGTRLTFRNSRSFLLPVYNFLFVEKSTVAKDALVVAKWLRRWLTTPLVLLALIVWALWPTPTRAIYADPALVPPLARLNIPLAKKLPPPTATTLAAEQPVAIPAPPPLTLFTPVAAYVAPTPAPTGGCTTWFSGDYYLDKIIRYESGGNSCATNPGGCFGLLQACPGYPLRAACGGSPSCQIAWFQANKTGGRSWATVWQHELDFGWW